MTKVQFLGKQTDKGFNYHYCVTSNPIDDNTIVVTKKSDKVRKDNNLTTLWQVFDDDGNKYFSGYYNEDKICPLTILDRFMYNYGATYIMVRNKTNGKMEMV